MGTDPLALLNSGVDAKGNFNLSGVLFIPPPNTAGTLTAEFRLRHRRVIQRRRRLLVLLQMGEVLHLRLVRLRMRLRCHVATDLSADGYGGCCGRY